VPFFPHFCRIFHRGIMAHLEQEGWTEEQPLPREEQHDQGMGLPGDALAQMNCRENEALVMPTARNEQPQTVQNQEGRGGWAETYPQKM
jgi:hypothetical protein